MILDILIAALIAMALTTDGQIVTKHEEPNTQGMNHENQKHHMGR